MTRRRVLHCIPGMGGGGAERQLAYLAGALPPLGWEVHVALTGGGPNFERLARSGAVVHRLSPWGSHDPRLLWQLARRMHLVDPDVVHVWLIQMEVAGGLMASVHRVPWLLSERSSAGAYPPTWKNRLRVTMASLASAVVSNSKDGDRYWAARLGRGIPRFVVPNAVPVAEIEASAPADPSELGLPEHSRLILFAGRLSAEKNVRTLLRALTLVLAQEPDTVALLAGEGPERGALEREREPALSARVILPGYLAEPWRWMKQASVFASVSHFEGHPNAVLEAAAAGTPLVLSDTPSHRAMLDERCALFVPTADSIAIAAAIRTVLRDPDAARARARRAAARVGQLRIERVAREYDRIYRQLLNTGPTHVDLETEAAAGAAEEIGRTDPAGVDQLRRTMRRPPARPAAAHSVSV